MADQVRFLEMRCYEEIEVIVLRGRKNGGRGAGMLGAGVFGGDRVVGGRRMVGQGSQKVQPRVVAGHGGISVGGGKGVPDDVLDP